MHQDGSKHHFPVAQATSDEVRVLTDEQKTKLEKDTTLLSDYKKDKLEKDAKKNWDLFYKRNSTNFFKDRHWTHREFPELSNENLSKDGIKLLEVGCGCGNLIFPIIKENEEVFVYACDFSPRAVQFVQANDLYDKTRCLAFQCDITIDELNENIQADSVDIVTMIFVLSAISPNKMKHVFENIIKILKPGGSILFRDYGLYDHAMLRFNPGHKIEENFYVRQDGTRAYYFTTDFMNELAVSSGFTVNNNQYVLKRTVNKKEGIDVPRIFVQAKFTKAL